jgi:hypothetical protein
MTAARTKKTTKKTKTTVNAGPAAQGRDRVGSGLDHHRRRAQYH